MKWVVIGIFNREFDRGNTFTGAPEFHQTYPPPEGDGDDLRRFLPPYQYLGVAELSSTSAQAFSEWKATAAGSAFLQKCNGKYFLQAISL
jgi:hypothetical protein